MGHQGMIGVLQGYVYDTQCEPSNLLAPHHLPTPLTDVISPFSVATYTHSTTALHLWLACTCRTRTHDEESEAFKRQATH
jgi:hypothetical protein